MSPAPRPQPIPAPHDHAATCLETDEDVLNALRAELAGNVLLPPTAGASVARPHDAAPAAPGSSRTATPQAPAGVPAGQRAAASGAQPYRPTQRPPLAILTVCDDGKSEGENIRIRDNRFVIGRTEGELRITHDPLISSRHIEITLQAVEGRHRWVIVDLQSTNGLFARVLKTPLVDGSEFLVGQGRYHFSNPAPGLAETADFKAVEARSSTLAWSGAEQLPRAAPTLIELVGAATGSRTMLTLPEYWIGVDHTCQICRVGDPFCEPHHARVMRDARGGWHLERAKCLNGVWFRVPQIVVDKVAYFQIGEQRFRLSVGI